LSFRIITQKTTRIKENCNKFANIGTDVSKHLEIKDTKIEID
jgi:hypothetical protein